MTSKIFVGHLSEQTTEEALRTVFEQFGEVKQLDLRTGFAFVLFGSEEEAQRAIEAMHDKELDGNRIRVEKERGSGEGSFRADRVKPPRRLDLRLVVRGLHPKVDWKDLKDWARETVGEVTYSNVFDRDGQHMGLIELKDEASVERALTVLVEVPLLGVKVTLERDSPDSEYSRIPPSGVTGSFHGGRGGYGGRGGFGGRGGGGGRGSGNGSGNGDYYADRGGDRFARGGDRYPRDNFGGARDPRDRDYGGGRGYYAQQAPPSSHGRDSRDREPPRDSRDGYYRGANDRGASDRGASDRDPRGRRDSRDTRGGDRYGAPMQHGAPHHAAYNNYDAPPRRYGDDVGYAPPHRDRSRSRSRDRGHFAPPAGANSSSTHSNSHSNGRGGRYYDGPRR